jgi:hypothetical protein
MAGSPIDLKIQIQDQVSIIDIMPDYSKFGLNGPPRPLPLSYL